MTVFKYLRTGEVHNTKCVRHAARSVSNFRCCASFGRQQTEMTFEMEDAMNYVHRSPVGTVGLITPWNLPLYLLTWKVIPALAAGSTCVLKPSEHTPLSATLYAEFIDAAGFPKGSFNLVHGDGPTVGSAMSCHPDVQMMSFTGSTRGGHFCN